MGFLSEKALTGVLVLAALTSTAVLVRREVLNNGGGAGGAANTPQKAPGWESLMAAGRVIGSDTARVKIAAFMDMQCPFCRRFHDVARLAMTQYPGQVAIVYIHFPLPGHRQAIPAARALECAHAQGRFAAMVDLFFEQHDSLSARDSTDIAPWSHDAARVGVSDTQAFAACMGKSELPVAVKNGLALSASFGITGTPTVIVNGWRFPRPPSELELRQHIDKLLAAPDRRSLLARLFGGG
jgi:protein-disulfide isomerase